MQENNQIKIIAPIDMGTVDTVGAPPARLNFCNMCKKNWKNDPYCPHPFDNDKVWRLKKISKKIKFSTIDGKEKIEFFDVKNNLIGEYITPNN